MDQDLDKENPFSRKGEEWTNLVSLKRFKVGCSRFVEKNIKDILPNNNKRFVIAGRKI